MTLYSALLITELILALPVFILLFFIKAPYGKFLKKGWGPEIKASFAWFIMELPVVVIPMFFFIISKHTDEIIYLLFIAIWELHYIQRTLIYPFIMNKHSHKMPLLIILFSALFNLINGYIIGYGTFILGPQTVQNFFPIRLVPGLLIFFIGFIINISSDNILRHLRNPGETEYKIPRKGLFKYICNPNYFGEILEWTGWAVMTCTPAAAAFLLFTTANLVPRAAANLKWYRKTFPDYPKERKAILPFIF